MRTVFAGTPELAADILSALLNHPKIELIGVYTQPDRPAGRGKKLTPSPVKALAVEHAIPVYQPHTLRDPDAQAALAQLRPELMIVAAYGLILPIEVLQIPRFGCINVHASLLPRWRGAAPVERALEAGDACSGITIMQMDEGLDTGPMLNSARCPIEADETGNSLRIKLTAMGIDVLLNTLDQLTTGKLTPVAQPTQGITYANKLERHEALIDWQQSASALARRIRAFNPANICQTTVADQRLNILAAHSVDSTLSASPGTILDSDRKRIIVACGTGTLSLDRLQLAGGKPMDAASMLNGRAALFLPGTRLGPSQ